MIYYTKRVYISYLGFNFLKTKADKSIFVTSVV